MNNKTEQGQATADRIIQTGLELWRNDPASVSARRIGTILGMKHNGILYHFGDVAGLKDAIAREAVRIGDKDIVPGLIINRHASTAGMSESDRAAYLSGF